MGTADSDNGDNPYDTETDVDLDLEPDEAGKKNELKKSKCPMPI